MALVRFQDIDWSMFYRTGAFREVKSQPKRNRLTEVRREGDGGARPIGIWDGTSYRDMGWG